MTMNVDIMTLLRTTNYRRLIFVRRFLILSIVMVFSAICIILFAVIPQVQQIFETQTMIKTENGTLANLKRKIQGLAQVNDLEEYANKEKVDEALPFQKPLLPILETAKRVSGESGVRLISFETTPGKLASISAQPVNAITAVNASGSATSVKGVVVNQVYDATGDQIHGVDKMDISVTVQGSLAKISDFISRIEKSTPVTNVTEIRLDNEVRMPDGPPEFTAALRLSSFYFTRAIQVAIDAPLPETGAKERAFLKELEGYTISSQVTNSSTVEGGGQNDLFGIKR